MKYTMVLAHGGPEKQETKLGTKNLKAPEGAALKPQRPKCEE